MLGRNVEDAEDKVRDEVDEAVPETADTETGPERPEPVMPSPPFPTFQSRPTLPHQVPGVGFESGRDSRAR
ncbi:hypothetical protein [Actinoplanes friuliensis]|uniref:hypothetical protein n=1 Tax=Actinoplanes friuliensis TaxID=196914 RepID=UPI0011DE2877|nr:hypothetical protein [Actinoplanes friuliensis]